MYRRTITKQPLSSINGEGITRIYLDAKRIKDKKEEKRFHFKMRKYRKACLKAALDGKPYRVFTFGHNNALRDNLYREFEGFHAEVARPGVFIVYFDNVDELYTKDLYRD